MKRVTFVVVGFMVVLTLLLTTKPNCIDKTEKKDNIFFRDKT